MKTAASHSLTAALILALFGLLGTALVSVTNALTHEQIAENERQALLHTLYALIPAEKLDNDLYTDRLMIADLALLGTSTPTPTYRARKGGKPIAVVLTPTAPDGYSGRIQLLVGIYYDGSLAGVRVVSHKETPGLGDGIEADRSDWIRDFNGHSLQNPDESGWAVQKDGGIFDQFTGATITPRAVVKAVHRSLVYFNDHRDELFAPMPNPAPQPDQKTS